MKRLALLLLILVSFSASAQIVTDRGSAGVTVRDYRWMGGYNAFMPRFADTTAANLQKGIDSSGAVIYTYDVKGFWIRQHSPKKWALLSSGSAPITDLYKVKITSGDNSGGYLTDKLLGGYGFTKTTVSDGSGNEWINFIVDTTSISTRAWRQKGVDSVVALINSIPTPSLQEVTDIGNTTSNIIEVTKTSSVTSPSLQVGNFQATSGITAGEIRGLYPYTCLSEISGGTINFEAANYSSVTEQTGGSAPVLEGFGAIMNHSGGTNTGIRQFASNGFLSADVAGNYSAGLHSATHSAGNIQEVRGYHWTYNQSTSSASAGAVYGWNGNILTRGTVNTISGMNLRNEVDGGTVAAFRGGLIQNIITSGSVSTSTGLEIQMNTSGASSLGLARGLTVFGPNGVSTEPYVAVFQSMQATSYGVAIGGASGQTQDLLNVINSVGGNLFKVTAAGNIVAGSKAGIGNSGPDNTLTVGNAFGAFSGHYITVGNTSDASGFVAGQSASNNLVFDWVYNATPSSAYARLVTSGYSNPIRLDGSSTLIQSTNTSGGVGIGTTSVNASAKVEISSTTRGFLPPRMTAAQAGAIGSPAEGLLVYVTDTDATFTSKGWWGYDGAAWQKLNN